jgi:hypothetical protein
VQKPPGVGASIEPLEMVKAANPGTVVRVELCGKNALSESCQEKRSRHDRVIVVVKERDVRIAFHW